MIIEFRAVLVVVGDGLWIVVENEACVVACGARRVGDGVGAVV